MITAEVFQENIAEVFQENIMWNSGLGDLEESATSYS